MSELASCFGSRDQFRMFHFLPVCFWDFFFSKLKGNNGISLNILQYKYNQYKYRNFLPTLFQGEISSLVFSEVINTQQGSGRL